MGYTHAKTDDVFHKEGRVLELRPSVQIKVSIMLTKEIQGLVEI